MTQDEALPELTDEELEGFRKGFEQGFGAARRLFGTVTSVEDHEVVKKLPAGSLVKDRQGRVHFKTTSNGWVSIAATNTSSMYLALPLEILYHG